MYNSPSSEQFNTFLFCSHAPVYREYRIGIVNTERFTIHNSRFTILNLQFSILNSRFTILNLQFSILNSRFTILDLRFSIFGSQFTILNFRFSILNSRFTILNSGIHLGVWLYYFRFSRVSFSFACTPY